MKTKIFLVVFVVMSVFGNTIYAQTACPGWKNPLNFPMNPNYSGQTGSRPDGTSTYQQMYMTMTSAVIPAAQLATVQSAGSSSSCVGTGNAETNRFVIKDRGTDPNANNQLTYTPPSDTSFFKSIRLGNCYGGAEAEGLYYTMQVTPQNALVFINYAIVLYNALHGTEANPEFIIRVKRQDASGNFVNINDSLCYIVQSPTNSNNLGVWTLAGSAVYKPWAKAAVSLNEYLYETVRIEMYVGDCSYSAHYGYCYIAGDCQPMQLSASDCAAGASTDVATIEAPEGLATYQWQRKNYSGEWEDIPGATRYILGVQTTDFYMSDDGNRVATNDFRCRMTSALDPAKPITSYLSTTVNNMKPYISIDTTSYCDGTIVFTDRSIAPYIVSDADVVDTSLSVWDFGDGSPRKTGGVVTHRYANRGDYLVTLRSSAANGTCYAEASRDFHARKRPRLTIAYDGDSVICRGTKKVFRSSTEEFLRDYLWVVHRQDGFKDTIRNDEELHYTFQDTSVVELRVFNSEGCDTAVFMNVYAQDYPKLIVTGDTIVCNGTQSIVNVSSNIPNCTFGWYMDPSLSTPVYSGPQLVRTPTQDEKYYVKVTTPIGCEAWDSLSIRLMVPNMSSNINEVCSEGEVKLQAEGAAGYKWTASPIDSTLFGQDTARVITVYPKVTTTYTMVGIGQNGCEASPLKKTIKVYPYPAPILDYTPNFVDSEDPTVTFTDKSEGSVKTIWNFHNGDIFTQRSITYEFTDLEKDSVKVSMFTANELGCSADISVMLPISVFAVWFPNAFTPDKTENSVFKVSTTNDIRDYSLYIYNRDGLLVFSTNNVSEGWDGTYNGQKCKQGTYVYVSTYRRIETDKVVQQKGSLLLLR